MRVRNQIVEGDKVLLDTTLEARSDWAALHALLTSQGVEYDPGQFYRRGDWACYTGYSGQLYRTMSSRRFG